MKELLEREKIPETEFYSGLLTAENHDNQSICSTCIHAEHCVYRADGTKSIFACDEYEFIRAAAVTAKEPETKNARTEIDRSVGLCANCDHRHYCQYADEKIGIWYCEEYK